MTYIDYLNWAQEYKCQKEVLEQMLIRRKNKKSKLSAEQQIAFDSTNRMLYIMKLDCEKTAALLEKKAMAIKERINEA